MGVQDDIRKSRELREARRREEDKEPDTGKIVFKDESTKLTAEKLDEVFERGEKMLEQMNSTYAMFISGVETQRPDTRRKQLDALMVTIQMMPKPTAVYRFRAQNIIQTYNMYRDRWDRQMKDLENGRIKRAVRPGANRAA